MWIYEYYLQNGDRKLFYTDNTDIPEEVVNFYNKQKENIIDNYCDHFPMTINEFVDDKEKIGDNVVICK